jgi:Ser/Thr protein kinase RdoA (MazF antagonist)
VPDAAEVFAALGLADCRVVETLPPNWHGDDHWRARAGGGHELSVRTICTGRAMRVEETRGYELRTVLAQLRVADAFARSGVPMMAIAAGPVVLGESVAVAFEWLDGDIAVVADAARALRIGQLLATIHGLVLPSDSALPMHDAVSAAAAGLKRLDDYVGDRFTARASSVIERSGRVTTTPVVSHGDCNFPNVLWRADTIVGLVDIDQIGFVDPLEELAYAVKWWSRSRGIAVHEHDRELAAAVLAGYGDRELDRERLADLLWLTGCLNANSVEHIIAAPRAERPAVVAHLESRADTLAGLVV